MSWDRSISESKVTYNYINNFLNTFSELKETDKKTPAYHNIRDENLLDGDRIDDLIPQNKMDQVISKIEKYFSDNNQKSVCDGVDHLTSQEYPFFNKSSEDFFEEKNKNRNFCYITKLLKVDGTTSYSGIELDNKILEVTAGFQLILQWIEEKFSQIEKYRQNDLYSPHLRPSAGLGFGLLSKSTPLSDVLFSLKDTLLKNSESPFIYSTPKSFVNLKDFIKKEFSQKLDEQTWSYNMFFTQYVGDSNPLEKMVMDMVCGEKLESIPENILNRECNTTEDAANLTKDLPSFNKKVAGPYEFKIPQLFDIPKEEREKICEQGNHFYNIKGYDNLLDFLLEHKIDENAEENMNKQYNAMMKCFDQAYKKMYETKLKPVINSKENKEYIINEKVESIPKGTYESIKSQINYYMDLLIKDSEDILKEDIGREMDNFYNYCFQEECENEYYNTILNALEGGISLEGHYEEESTCLTFNVNAYQIYYSYGICPSLLELSITDKDKVQLMVVHEIMKLQTKILQLKKDISVADQIALPSR